MTQKLYSTKSLPVHLTWLTCCLFLITGMWTSTTFGQAPSTYSFAESSATYSPLSGGTVSTAIGDDGTQSGIPIGFNFNYNGATHTTFSLSTNGVITLTNAAPGGWWTNSIAGAPATNCIAPMWDDDNRSTGNISYLTSGIVGSQVLTICWENVSIGGGGSSGNATNNFKIELFEGTNVIRFSYGALTAANGLSASIGITGATGNYISVTPGAPATTSTSTPNNGISAVTFIPSGTVYTFTPPPACTSANGGIISPALQNLCSGQTSTMSSTGATSGVTGVTYQWQTSLTPGGPYSNVVGGSGANTTTYTSAALSPGTYYYVMQTTCANCGPCSSLSNELTVTVNGLPSVSVSPTSASICVPGGSATLLTASGASTYAWSPTTGLTPTTGNPVNALPAATTTYTVTGTDGNGCTGTATAAITINSGVSLTSVTAAPPAVCTGSNSTLTANIPAPSFTYCASTHASGCSGDDITNVVLNTISNPTSGCGGVSHYTYFTGGGSQTTTLSNSGSPYNCTVSFGTDGNQYFGAWIDYDQSGTFEVSEFLGASLNAGSSGTISVSFTVPPGALNGVTRLRIVGGNDSPVSAGQACGASSSSFGETQDYNVTITGGVDPFTYAWTPSTFLSSTNSNPTTAVAVTSNQTYTVTVTKLNGCTASGTASVTTDPLVCSAITASSPVCTGSSFTLTSNTSGGGQPYSYLWSTSETTASISANQAVAGSYTYTVTVTDACLNTCSSSITVVVNSTPTSSITPAGPITVCTNNLPTVLTANTSGASPSYVWKKDGAAIVPAETNATLNVTTSGSYTVVVTDGSCSSESAPVVVTVVTSAAPPATSPSTISVCEGALSSPGFAGSCSASGTQTSTTNTGSSGFPITWTSTVSASGTIPVTAFPPGSTITNVSVSINMAHTWGGDMVISLQAPNGGPNLFITNNAVVDPNLDYGSAGGVVPTLPYIWNSTGVALPGSGAVASPGPYAPFSSFAGYNGFDPNGTWTLSVVDAVGGDGGTIENLEITITANTIVSGPADWYSVPSGGTLITSASTFNPITDGGVNTAIPGTTTFYAECPGTSGCPSNRTPVTFIVNAAPVPTCGGTNVSCNGGSNGSANVSATGNGPFTYLWSTSNTNNIITGLTAGTYCVTVTDANGCTATCCYTVTEPAALAATAISSSASCPLCPDGSVIINSVSGGTPGYTFTNLSGLLPGNYCITVTDANGCTTSACATVGAAGCTLGANVTLNSNVTCFGLSNGNATATPTGGTIGPFTYLWDNGNTNATANDLNAGNHTVILSDLGSGCVTQGNVTITQPAILSASCGGTNVSCNGANNGTASVSVTGGTQFAGSTTVTYLLNDANIVNPGFNIGCPPNTRAYAQSLTGPDYGFSWTDGLSPSATITNIDLDVSFYLNCNGFTPRAVSLNTNAAGNINPLGTNCSACGSPLAVNSANLNAAIPFYNKSGLNDIRLLLNFVNFEGLIANPAWSSTDNIYARVHVTTSTATGGYSYLWNNGATTSSISGLAPGTYCVTVTDANGCTSTCCYTITEPATPLSASCSGTNVTVCASNTNGSASVVAAGGTPGYTYLWSNGATTSSLSAIGMGTYCVTVTDANGCTATCCYTVTGPPAIVLTTNVTNICNPGGTGDIDVSVTGGTPLTNIVYNFNGSLQGWTIASAGTNCNGSAPGPPTWALQSYGFTGQSIGLLGPNNQVEHSYVQSPIISLPANLNVTAKSWANNETGYPCFFDVEFVEYSTNGGATWTPFFTTIQANLHSSSGTVWENLSYSTTITPTNNGRIRFRFDSGDGCCGPTTGNPGWYLDDVTIAVPPGGYNYLWSNGATTQDLTGVPAGTYTVTVTDGNGCTSTASYTVLEPTVALSASCSGTNVSCNGGNNGSAGVIANDGIGPYTYLWNNASTVASQSGLTAGAYCVTVTDAIGCTAVCCYVVSEPVLLTASCSGTNVNCNGELTGSVSVSESGGTAPYSYLWDNASTSASQSGLLAGTYCVIITDINGCTATCCYTITEPSAPLSVTENHTDVSCYGGNDGTATANPAGGTPAYSYSWSNGATSQTTNGLTAGNYTCIVTDANGCTNSVIVNITEPPQLFISETHNNVSCKFGNDGSVDLTLTGGTPPFTFIWSNGATTEDISGVNALAYFVTVTEGNGCSQIFGVNITEPNAIATTASITNPTSGSPLSGAIDLSVSGGTPGFTFAWSNGATTEDISGLAAGTYTVVVTDANGCTHTAIFTLTLSCNLSAVNTIIQNASCFKNNGIASVAPSGGTSYTYAWQTSPVQTTSTGTGLAYGSNSYVLITDLTSGCTYMDTVVVPLTTSIGVVLTSPTYIGGKNIRCNGGSNGSINSSVSGDPGPFTYLWSTGATTSSISGVPAGIYTLTVTTGSGGCTSTSQITLTQPAGLVLTTTKVNPGCGASNGSATVSVTGGNAPYSYSWNTVPVKTTSTITGLAAGAYIVTVSDVNGCTKTALVTLTASGGLTVTGIVTNAKCFGSATGSIDITPSGGTAPYTYLWNTGHTTQDRLNVLAAGTYTVTVTDSKGCTGQFTATIAQPTAITATSSSTNVSCYGGTNGTASVTPSGGTPGYTYSWNTIPTKTTAAVTGLKKGTYTCLITDTKGCVKAVNVIITEPSAITIAVSKTNVTVFGGNNGTATANVGGGVAPYTYSWNTAPVQNTQTATGLIAGTYVVTVTDANGCTKTASVTITQPSSRTLGTDNSGDENFSLIYPNPTSGFVTITFNEVVQSKVMIDIYTFTGERVYTKEVKLETNNNSLNLDLSQFAKGVYTVKYQTGSNEWIDKLIIQ